MSQETFVVDVWTDVICPFCYLGERQLELALESFPHRDRVTVRRHAFELDPNFPSTFHGTLNEMLATKYGITLAQARNNHDRLALQAATLGLDVDFDNAKPTNTFDAHRLVAWAASQGLDEGMTQRLYRAYFVEGHVLSDRDTLVSLAREVGVVEPEEAFSEASTDAVRADEAAAHELGFNGVPAVIINRRYAVVGAQGEETFATTLQRAWDETGA